MWFSQKKLLTQEGTVKRFWTANNKESEPRPFLRNRQTPSIFTEASLGESTWGLGGGGVHVFFEWEKVQRTESQTREPAKATITSMYFGSLLFCQGALSLALDTKTAIERTISGLSLQIATLWYIEGVMNQQNVTSRLFTMMQDHLMAGRVEVITADCAGWFSDSLTSVSQNPSTRGYTLWLCVL